MTDYLDTGIAAHAIDLQIVNQSIRGYAVVNGVVPSKGGNPLETTVTTGTTLVGGTAVEFSASADQTAVHDAGDTDPRRDIVYVDNVSGDAVLQIEKGTPAQPVHGQGNSSVVFGDNPFEFAAPAPPTMNDITGTPVAEVAIPSGATDYTESAHLRSLRSTVDLHVNSTDIFAEHLLPEYDLTSNAPAVVGNLIRISGDGADSMGVYVYDGTQYVNLAQQITFDDLTIGDRNWSGSNITNVGDFSAANVTVNDSFRVDGGRGSFSLPDQHTRYEDGLSDAEIARWSLPSDEQLEVTLLEVTHKGGGTSTNFSVKLRDESDSTDLASTNDSVRGSPIATSTAGAEISLLVTNSSGGSIDATISGQLFRVLA